MTKHEIDQTPLAKCERERDEARIALARFESSSPELGDLSFREQLRSQLIRDGLNAMEERDEARRWLKFLYDKWENGTPCFEDPEDLEGPVGNAFKLSDAEEESILSLLRQAESPKESINVSV